MNAEDMIRHLNSLLPDEGPGDTEYVTTTEVKIGEDGSVEVGEWEAPIPLGKGKGEA